MVEDSNVSPYHFFKEDEWRGAHGSDLIDTG